MILDMRTLSIAFTNLQHGNQHLGNEEHKIAFEVAGERSSFSCRWHVITSMNYLALLQMNLHELLPTYKKNKLVLHFTATCQNQCH